MCTIHEAVGSGDVAAVRAILDDDRDSVNARDAVMCECVCAVIALSECVCVVCVCVASCAWCVWLSVCVDFRTFILIWDADEIILQNGRVCDLFLLIVLSFQRHESTKQKRTPANT